ncbi:MAG: CoA-transferase [Stellaceae bacterium]
MTTDMTSGAAAYTASELLAVMSARLLRDGQTVFAGVGIPLLAATLAQRLHGPGLTILFEGGTIGAFVEPGKLPPSTNEQRCTRRANMVLGSTDVLLLLQRGYVDVGFMGGAQIDQYGNLNSSSIGGRNGRAATRLPGTGGGNDIASLTQMIVAMKHEKRRFVERVDFVTSPGFLKGGDSRREAGLVAGGMYRVVTDLGLFGFEESSKRMTLLALHPGASVAQVQENTGFAVAVAADLSVTEPPTENELAVLRHLDPERLYTA